MALLRYTLLGLLAIVSASLASSVEVTTRAGTLRGKWMTSSQGRPIAAFEGIPYAKPPVGDMRFEPPAPADAWDGVRDAVQPGNMCVQRNVFLRFQHVEGDEDCLYLNVYAPQTVTRTDPLPVMVYIHGGGFMVGCGHAQGPQHLLNRDVVYVSINYRLGPLGFLSTVDSEIRGNFGLKDQVLALQWVRDNIAAFGGNADLVTIFGESAGAGSVHFHTLSPLSQGLFHRAIMMSGSALAPWAFDDTPKARAAAKKLAELVDCPSEPSADLKRCLQGKSAEELITTDYSLATWAVFHPLVPFKPTAEIPSPLAFLDRHPLEAYSSGLASNVPFMTGFVKHEGCIAVAPIIEWSDDYLKDLDKRFVELGALIFKSEHLPKSVNNKVFSQARQLYFGGEPIDHKARSQLVDFFSDTMFVVSSLESALLQRRAASAPVFVYELEHYSDRSFSLAIGAKDSYGMCHGDDLLHVFPLNEAFPQEPSADDRVFSNKMVDLFTTFAATGQPTQDGSWRSVEDGAKAEYAHVTSQGLTMLRDFAPERVQLWRQQSVNMALASPNLIAREEL